MPWKEKSVVDERVEFVVRARRGETVSALCREYGISRKTGHKFLRRYADGGPEALHDMSRAPTRRARATAPEIEAKIVAEKKKYASWGAAKLRAVLSEREPGVSWPVRSTFETILRRHGLVEPKKRRRNVPRLPGPLTQPNAPNHVWAIDYKGQFRLQSARYCYPLTVSDLHTRFLLGCDALSDTRMGPAIDAFLRLFDEYGLPDVIRSDNGTPFASRALLGLTRLSAIFAALDIRHERITPGKPQQNGSHERMHLTLKREATRPASRNIIAQQERFDAFRERFNHVRPHEALGMKRPGELYRRSERPLPKRIALAYPLADDVRRVTKSGHLACGHGGVFLARPLAGFDVGLTEIADDVFTVTFAALNLGTLDYRNRRFVAADKAVS